MPLLLFLASCTAVVQKTAPPGPEAEEPIIAVTAADPTPPKPEGHLGHPVCVGPVLAADPPRSKMICCYPAMELIRRPIREAYPALRACFDNRQNKDAVGRVAFAFRIEQDGSVQHVCAAESSTMDDEPAARCMAEAMRKVRFSAMSKEERAMCGLISLSYPVTFEP